MRKRADAFADIPPIDSEMEDIFERYGLGVDDSMDEDMDDDDSDSDMESDTEDVLQSSCSGIQDLLLTGEVCAYIFIGVVIVHFN